MLLHNKIFNSNTILRWLGKNLFPALHRLSEVRALKAVRDAIYSSFPAIAIGFVVVFVFLNTKVKLNERAFEAFRGGLSFMAIWVSFSLGAKLGRLWNLGWRASSILAFILFFITFPKFDFHLIGIHHLFEYLSQGGLFVAILLSITFLKFAKYLHVKFFLQKCKKDLATLLARGVAFFLLAGVMLVFAKFGIVVHDLMFKIFQPLMYAGDSLLWILIIIGLMNFMWVIGLHGSGMIGAIVMPLYLVMLQNNFEAYTSGHELLYIVTPPFLYLCFQGGSGATFPLLLHMLRSKSVKLRKLAKAAFLPSLVNINEILIFGLPIVMNPILAVPFVAAPVIICFINYMAFYFHMVDRIFVLVPFCIPIPILAYIVTGGDFKALILTVIDFIVISILWWPFFKVYEKKVCEEEVAQHV